MQLFGQDQHHTPQALEFRKIKQEQALLEARIELEKKKMEFRLLQENRGEESDDCIEKLSGDDDDVALL